MEENMSRIVKCDVCEKEIGDDCEEGISIFNYMIITIQNGVKYNRKEEYDLCKDCNRQFRRDMEKWIKIL